jgi:FkbM family methyltransferase
MKRFGGLRHYLGSRLRDYIPLGGRVSYSQEGEDLLIERFLNVDHGVSGFFVDVGAHHPTRFSNTYRLYRRGWRGINIDALPGSKRLFDRRRPRDINIECGVAEVRGKLEYIQFNDAALNTFSAEEAARKCHPPFFIVSKVDVPVVPLAELLQMHLPKGQLIDFMSVDVEGFDYEVIASNDWQRFRPTLVLLEMLGVPYARVAEQPAGRLLESVGYTPVAKTYNTVVFQQA